MSRPLSLRDVAAFFLPLALTSNLMMIAHSVIAAAMARWDQPTVGLAAFNAVFTFHTILSSPTVVAPFTMLAFLRDRGAMWQLFRFHAWVMALPILASFAVGLTPLGMWLFGGVLGASAPVALQAQQATLIFAVLHPVIALRSMANSLFMMHRRTLVITLGTSVRLAALFALVFGVGHWIGGAPGGALSLVGGICVETLFTLYMARGYLRELPASTGAVPSQREIWGFAWPLMISQFTEGSLAFTINIFLGRLAQPDLALAAFGVVRSLGMLLLSPLRNLAPTAQALARATGDHRVLLRFTWITTGVITGLIGLLFWTGLRPVILNDVMGLQPELSVYCAAGVRTILAVPLFWGLSALFRGLLSSQRQTRAIGISALFKMAGVVSVGSITLIAPHANGTVVGIAALAAAFGGESAVLGLRYLRAGGRASRAESKAQETVAGRGERPAPVTPPGGGA